ncbi:hypothetical protein [Polyangium fumosum]|uniref:Uncharacterized protein n=1 Tax=Polyangium fumosum TaxID=889272 RepID=A0A4U1IL73_9BACT|nr:hypothetical protein [Polyangium fumosum]TKC94720.1 hypothetical protein E8A74_47635 [Polyangium fumosum]
MADDREQRASETDPEEALAEPLKAVPARALAPQHEGPVARLVAEIRAGDSPGQTLLATFVAWSATVAPAALSRSAARPAAFVAVVGLVAGLAGPLFRGSRPTLARHVGITAFLALTTGAWLLGSPALTPARLDPLRASVGAIAWGAFALSWRERWETGPSKHEVPKDPDAPLLQARSTLPRGAIPIATVGILSGLVYLVLAWHVRDGDRALAAQAVAVACAVAISVVAAMVAVERGRRSSRSSRRMTPAAGKALLMLVVFVVAGVAVVLMRR